jgi:hypothetical protein
MTKNKGDRTQCENYRGISLLPIATKILEAVVAKRLKEVIDSSLRDNQCGFRKSRSCADQIFGLRQVIEQRYEFRRPTYICFVDFKAAFDSVDRAGMWHIQGGKRAH